MLDRLHAGQRFWLLFATVFFASAMAVLVVAWPRPDAAIVADLQSPDCEPWRGLPAGMIPEVYPNPDDSCFALRRFLIEERADVRSEADYDGYLGTQRARTVWRILGGWAAFCLLFYALGWAGVRLGRRLWPSGGRQVS